MFDGGGRHQLNEVVIATDNSKPPMVGCHGWPSILVRVPVLRDNPYIAEEKAATVRSWTLTSIGGQPLQLLFVELFIIDYFFSYAYLWSIWLHTMHRSVSSHRRIYANPMLVPFCAPVEYDEKLKQKRFILVYCTTPQLLYDLSTSWHVRQRQASWMKGKRHIRCMAHLITRDEG